MEPIEELLLEIRHALKSRGEFKVMDIIEELLEDFDSILYDSGHIKEDKED